MLPDVIIDKLLPHAALDSPKHASKTYHNIMGTCKKFQIIKEKGRDMLPRFHVKPDDFLQTLPSYNKKIKISVQKIKKKIGECSGLSLRLPEIIGDANWRSAWLILIKASHSWYIIDRIYWRRRRCGGNTSAKGIGEQKEVLIPADEKKGVFWLQNDMYYLKMEDKLILMNKTCCLNDRIMDTIQRFFCKTLGNEDAYQSVLNSQKEFEEPFKAVENDHTQLLHNGNNHWLLSYSTNGQVFICDSMRGKLNRVTRKCVDALYRFCKNKWGNVIISYLPVQKQTDGHSCGHFAIAFAVEVLYDKTAGA